MTTYGACLGREDEIKKEPQVDYSFEDTKDFNILMNMVNDLENSVTIGERIKRESVNDFEDDNIINNFEEDLVKIKDEASIFEEDQYSLTNLLLNLKGEVEEKENTDRETIFNKNISLQLLKIPKVKIVKLCLYMCDHCPSYFRNKNSILTHIHTVHFLMFKSFKTSNSLNRHECKLCGKRFIYRHWHEHVINTHSLQMHKCEKCNKSFKCERYLMKHVHSVHEGIHRVAMLEKQSNGVGSKCNLCSKVLRNKDALKTHIRTSHSEKKFTCNICNSTLKCQAYLYGHMRRVHYDDGKIHKCCKCNKIFRSPRYLKIHLKNSHYVSFRTNLENNKMEQ